MDDEPQFEEEASQKMMEELTLSIAALSDKMRSLESDRRQLVRTRKHKADCCCYFCIPPF